MAPSRPRTRRHRSTPSPAASPLAWRSRGARHSGTGNLPTAAAARAHLRPGAGRTVPACSPPRTPRPGARPSTAPPAGAAATAVRRQGSRKGDAFEGRDAIVNLRLQFAAVHSQDALLCGVSATHRCQSQQDGANHKTRRIISRLLSRASSLTETSTSGPRPVCCSNRRKESGYFHGCRSPAGAPRSRPHRAD